MDRDRYRTLLAGLTDAELREESFRRIVAYRGLRPGPDRLAANGVASLCWGECKDRGKPELYHAALDRVRREEAERRAANARAAEEIGATRPRGVER